MKHIRGKIIENDDFRDISFLIEDSLDDVWNNNKDKIWNNYLIK